MLWQHALLQFADGLGGPRARVQHIHRLSRQAQVHRHHRELHAPPALHEDHRVLFRDGQKPAQVLLRGVVDGLKFRGAVRKLHHRHAGAAIIQQLFPDALQHRQRQRRGPGVEIEGALYGA